MGASAVDKLLQGSNKCVVAQPKGKIELIHFDKLVAKHQLDMKDYYELIFKLAWHILDSFKNKIIRLYL